MEHTGIYGQKYEFNDVNFERWHQDEYLCEDNKYRYLYMIKHKERMLFYVGKHVTKKINDNYFASGIKINRSKNKYGIDAFNRSIMYFFENDRDLIEAEQMYILGMDSINNGYNLVVSSTNGYFSEEVKKKISDSRKKWLESSDKKAWNQGLKNFESDYTKQKRIDSLKGRKRPREVVDKFIQKRKDNIEEKIKKGEPVNKRCIQLKVTDITTGEVFHYNSNKEYQRQVRKIHVINYIRTGKLLHKKYKFERYEKRF